MKRFFAVLLLALAACCAPVNDDLNERTAMWLEIAQPSVQVINVTGGSGSGTVIAQDGTYAMILTAAHVVVSSDGTMVVMVTRPKHDAINGVVVALDQALDLAVIRTAPTWPGVAARARGALPASVGWGARVMIYGHPLGKEQGVLTEGRIASVSDGGRVSYTAPSFYGNSGGGVFVQIDGCWTLLSVVQQISVAQGPSGEIMPYASLGYGVHPYKLMRFLEGAKDVR